MKRKDYLVCLKHNVESFTPNNGSATFKPHKAYRCIELSEGNQTEMLVFGIVFDKKTFEANFEFVLDRAKRHFEFLGLTTNGKPVTKTKFKALADIHQYGRGKNMLNVVYFHGFDKDRIMYGFYPSFRGDSKALCLKNAYSMFIDFLSGESDDFDCEDIQFGNAGIPITYGDIGQRFVEINEKSIL